MVLSSSFSCENRRNSNSSATSSGMAGHGCQNDQSRRSSACSVETVVHHTHENNKETRRGSNDSLIDLIAGEDKLFGIINSRRSSVESCCESTLQELRWHTSVARRISEDSTISETSLWDFQDNRPW